MEPETILEPTNTEQTQTQTEAETSEHSKTQQRIDELTARYHETQAQLAKRDEQIISLMQQVVPKPAAPVPDQISIPDGIDPVQAKFFKDMIEANTKQIIAQTQAMYGQVAQSIDQRDVDQRFNNVPPEVRTKAKEYYNIMKRKYSDASMEDAVDKAWGELLRTGKQNTQARQQFNALGQPIAAQSAMSNFSAPVVNSNTLTPPTQDADWDNIPLHEQNKRIDVFIKKGGKLVG